MPWSRAQIAATAGAFSLVTEKSGRTAIAPGDEQPDGLVCREEGKVEGAASRGAACRPARSRPAGRGPAGPAGPGPGTPAPRRCGAAPATVTRTLSPGAARRRSATTAPGVDDLLEVVEDQEDALAGQPLDQDVAAGAAAGLGQPDRRRRSATRRGPGRGPSRAARRRRRPGSRRRPRPRPGGRAASCPFRPGRSGSRAGFARSSPAAGELGSRPTNEVSWVGRLLGRASSVRERRERRRQVRRGSAGRGARARGGP